MRIKDTDGEKIFPEFPTKSYFFSIRVVPPYNMGATNKNNKNIEILNCELIIKE